MLTSAFLSVELALAMILLTQVAVASYIANRPLPTDTRINASEIVTAAVTLPAGSYGSARQRSDYFVRLEDRLKARAEVVSVSRATVLPGGGTGPRRLEIRGQEQPDGEAAPTVLTIEISPRYFETLELSVLKGRDFTPLDGRLGNAAAIVNDYASAPPTLLKTGAFILALVAVSCFIPLRRATRMSPIAALRHD